MVFRYDYSFFFFLVSRCRRGKVLLLGSLVCWILFTIPLSFIKPEPVKCLARNETDFILTYTRTKRDLSAFKSNVLLSDSDSDSDKLQLENNAAINATLNVTSMESGEEAEDEVIHKRQVLL